MVFFFKARTRAPIIIQGWGGFQCNCRSLLFVDPGESVTCSYCGMGWYRR